MDPDTAPKRSERRPLTTGRVLLVDDDESIRRALSRELGQSGFAIDEAANAEEAIRRLRHEPIEAVLLDIRMPGASGMELLPEIKRRWPRVEVVMLTGHGDVESAVACMRAGALDFLQKPCHLGELEGTLSRAIERCRLKEQNQELKRRLGSGGSSPEVEMIGESAAIREVQSLIERVAPTDVSVVIEGESGTGKELVAQRIVARSRRAGAPLFALNCGALPETLLESELFGHERGAFTGAEERRLGFFELADGGTMFLDEIGEMPAAMQAKLLRVLQAGEFFRVGSTEAQRTDVRVLAATNRDLQEEVQAGRFREDLLYRLNTVMIRVPPLRERAEDLPALVNHILRHQLDDVPGDAEISDEALETLRSHHWPGNVRELQNALRSAAIMAESGRIGVDHLPQHLRGGEESAEAEAGRGSLLSLDEVERRHILAVLDDCGGNKAETARRLGITKKTLYSKLVLYGRHVRGGD